MDLGAQSCTRLRRLEDEAEFQTGGLEPYPTEPRNGALVTLAELRVALTYFLFLPKPAKCSLAWCGSKGPCSEATCDF